MSKKLVKKTFTIEGMGCGSCVAKIEKAIKELATTEGVKVNLKSGELTLKFDVEQLEVSDIILRVQELGFDIILQN